MHFLLLNQTFYPDVASTAQHLTDLALGLVDRGHEVTVVTSRRAYDDPGKLFPKNETWRGIRIIRIGSTGFGKGAKWRRAADFASFLVFCALRLIFLRRPDAVVALTSPPLISFLGACFARLRRSRFFYWVMDFNPDEAIAAGWLKADSVAAKLLDSLSRFSLNRANRVIALDRFMRDRIISKGIPEAKIVVLPPWSHDSEVRFDPDGRERFRKAHGLDGKFVVMYSGNHSPCHPLDTLLEASRRMANDPDTVFCFVGGGSEWRRIRDHGTTGPFKCGVGNAECGIPETAATSPLPSPPEAEREGAPHSTLSTPNSEFSTPSSVIPHSALRTPHLLCLPYQPLSQLAGSLSAADLHVVVMGERMVGLVHPCKIYNILTVAAPVLYIGPRPSHLSEIMDFLNGEYIHAASNHGNVDQIVQQIRQARRDSTALKRQLPQHLLANFSKEAILPQLIAQLEMR